MSAHVSLAGQSVLVTGGTGFIGRQLVSRLTAKGARVSLLQRRQNGSDGPCEVLTADFSADDAAAQIELALAGRRFDAIFNLAAYGVTRPVDVSASGLRRERLMARRVNMDSARTLALHAVAKRSGVFVQAGTCSEYAPPAADTPRVETDATERRQDDDRFIYGVSKVMATDALLRLVEGTDMPLVAARIFNVYGPGEKMPRLLPCLVHGLVQGQRVPLSSGRQIKDYLHLDDVTEGLCAFAVAARNQNFQGVMNLSSGEAVSVAQFARAVASAMGQNEELLGFGDRQAHKDEVNVLVGSTAAREALTDWRPKLSLEFGLQDAIHHLISPRFD